MATIFERSDVESLPFTTGGMFDLEWEWGVSPNVLRCLYRHLAAAAAQLVEEPGRPPEDAARFAAASARFRSLVEAREGFRERAFQAGPVVEGGTGEPTPLVVLLIDACLQYGLALPLRSIDPDLVHEARSLLGTLDWRLPDDVREARPVPGPLY